MLKKNKFIASCVMGFVVMAIGACASAPKADIPATSNPQEEISKLESDIHFAVQKNIDVLAKNEFESSIKWMEEAKSDLASKSKQEEILDDVRKGRGFLDQAYAKAGNKGSKAVTLFEARQMALKAGAGTQPELQKELRELDSDVSKKSDELQSVSSEKLIKFQEGYINLERKATILGQLSNAQAILNGARKDGALKKAPDTFKKTEISLKNAESVISTNVRNPEGYRNAVAQTNAQAALLMDVMTTIAQNGKNIPESTALKLVAQNRQIKNLKTDLTMTTQVAADSVNAEMALQEKNKQLSSDLSTKEQTLQQTRENLNATNSDLDSTKKNLSTTQNNLNAASASVEFQKAMETSRKKFSSDEAEAYQQGNNLLIRLKNINFASGRSDLPGASLATLAKVSEVAKSLNATEIKIEGHTDSIGNATQNKTISEERASAVASYFKSNGFNNIAVESEGYGFEKPIATNKSKVGRAQNRRVDIIITPEVTTK